MKKLILLNLLFAINIGQCIYCQGIPKRVRVNSATSATYNNYKPGNTISEKWQNNGGDKGIIGAAIDNVDIRFEGGFYRRFTKGAIIQGSGKPAFFVPTNIFNYWLNTFITTHQQPFGVPTADVVNQTSGTYVSFSGPSAGNEFIITDAVAAGTHHIFGAIAKAWLDEGNFSGVGAPASNTLNYKYNKNLYYSKVGKNYIFWWKNQQPFILKEPFNNAWGLAFDYGNLLGMPTAKPFAISGGFVLPCEQGSVCHLATIKPQEDAVVGGKTILFFDRKKYEITNIDNSLKEAFKKYNYDLLVEVPQKKGNNAPGVNDAFYQNGTLYVSLFHISGKYALQYRPIYFAGSPENSNYQEIRSFKFDESNPYFIKNQVSLMPNMVYKIRFLDIIDVNVNDKNIVNKINASKDPADWTEFYILTGPSK